MVDRELHLVAHHLDQQRHGMHRVEVVFDHQDAPLGRRARLQAMKSGHGFVDEGLVLFWKSNRTRPC